MTIFDDASRFAVSCRVGLLLAGSGARRHGLRRSPMQRTVHQSDVRSDDPKLISPRRIELKARIVMESLVPDAVVTQVAQRARLEHPVSLIDLARPNTTARR